jgi:nitroreductase
VQKIAHHAFICTSPSRLLNEMKSGTLFALSQASEAALSVLLSRQSSWPLAEPGPTSAQLDLVFDAGLRAPDHGRLRPWRYVLIRGEARRHLGDVLVDIACARSPDEPRSAHEHKRRKAFAAPAIIALGAAVNTETHIPEQEQLFAVAASAMNMLNAIYALGLGGFWATGPDSYDDRLHAALGFQASERLLGFLFVGTPQQVDRTAARPARSDHVREWHAPAGG